MFKYNLLSLQKFLLYFYIEDTQTTDLKIHKKLTQNAYKSIFYST